MWTQALRSSGCNNTSPLIPPDMALSVKQYFQKLFDGWEDGKFEFRKTLCVTAIVL